MENLKVFVSSTCYDLNVVRSQLRNFITSFGYEPVMSDYSDVLYDPRVYTHTSCAQEVANCDVLILIIGTRFGGKIVPIALDMLDIEQVKKTSTKNEILDNPKNLSVTQMEVLKAIEIGVPIFSFIDSRVSHDHLVYEKNKDKNILDLIEFPYIEKKETAKYIFEFINFLRHRIENNSIVEFSKMEDIELLLQKQWSGLFQRLLNEQRHKKSDEKKMDLLANQIADIKTALMSTISTTEAREIARDAIRFRRLVQFLYEFNNPDISTILLQNITWEELLEKFRVVDIRTMLHNETILLLDDRTYYRLRMPHRMLLVFSMQWNEFRLLSDDKKKAIFSAGIDNNEMRARYLRYCSEQFMDSEVTEEVAITESTEV